PARYPDQPQVGAQWGGGPLRRRKRQRAGAEQRPSAPPRRDRLRRIGKGQRNEPRIRQPFHMVADDAEVMRPHETRRGYAGLRGERGKPRDRQLNRRKRKAVGGIA